MQEAADRDIGWGVEQNVASILSALDEMADEHRSLGYLPSACIVTGSLGQRLCQELQKVLQNPWAWYRERDINAGRATHRFVGVHDGLPVVAIEAVQTPMLYVIDLARFGTLTRYGVGPDYEPEFDVKTFSDEGARRVLERQPRLILDPPPESGQDEERVRQLQLRVGLELWETYELTVKDSQAVIARPLVDPRLE